MSKKTQIPLNLYALAARVEASEQRVAELEQRVAALEAAKPAAPQRDVDPRSPFEELL